MALSSCASVTQDRDPVLHPPRLMTYEDCATARSCVIHGVARARIGEHGPIARLELADGRCLNVSLPRTSQESLRRDGPRPMTVSGRVFNEPSDQDGDVILEVEGRRIGYGLCGNFFIFVADRN